MRIESHRASLCGSLRRCLQLGLQKVEDRVNELEAMDADVVCQPLVQVEVLSSGGKSRHIQCEGERPHLKKWFEDLEASRISSGVIRAMTILP